MNQHIHSLSVSLSHPIKSSPDMHVLVQETLAFLNHRPSTTRSSNKRFSRILKGTSRYTKSSIRFHHHLPLRIPTQKSYKWITNALAISYLISYSNLLLRLETNPTVSNITVVVEEVNWVDSPSSQDDEMFRIGTMKESILSLLWYSWTTKQRAVLAHIKWKSFERNRSKPAQTWR